MTDYCPNWLEKNKFKKILAVIDSNKFGHKNKIGEFNYIEIKDLANDIKNNTISETSAKEGLNALNEVKNAEIIKYKRCTSKQKKLLSILFKDLLDTFLTNKSESQKDKNENENENDKTLM